VCVDESRCDNRELAHEVPDPVRRHSLDSTPFEEDVGMFHDLLARVQSLSEYRLHGGEYSESRLFDQGATVRIQLAYV